MPIDPILIDQQRTGLMAEMARFYTQLTGCECEANFFCVSKTSMRGCYYVHRLDSCDFYEVNVKMELTNA